MSAKIAALLVWFAFSAVPLADAAPILLTQAEFDASIVGLTTVEEDFEAFASGVQTNPFTFANGTITVGPGGVPFVTSAANVCGAGGDQCLSSSALAPLRTFSAFPADTTHWAVTNFSALVSANIFRITVTGNSGSSVFDLGAAWTVSPRRGVSFRRFPRRES